MHLDHTTLELRPAEPFHIARPSDPYRRRNVWVTVRDGEGHEGWGEAAANAFYGDTADTVTGALATYADALDEIEDPFALDRIERSLEARLRRNPAARAAISAALHDLVGKRLGAPVWRLWGLDPADAPPSSFTLGMDSTEKTRHRARQNSDRPVLKVKVGGEEDEARLHAIREEAPDATLYVDANTAWTAKEAVRALPMLEEVGVAFLEQPVAADDIAGLAAVRAAARIPVIADESCETAADIPRLLGAVDGINIKLAKAGSLGEAVRMAHVARAHGLHVMLGCMVESTLGIAAAIQLAPLVDYADLDGALLLDDDPFVGPGMDPDGTLRFNDDPGLGVTAR